MRESPAQSAERVAFLSEVFDGWVPADLAGAVSFRGQAFSLQASGPAAYVAGLLGKDDRWRHGMLKIRDAMPLAERLKSCGLGSRDEIMVWDGTKKYFPWCESPKEAAEMVAEFLKTTAENIKVSKCLQATT